MEQSKFGHITELDGVRGIACIAVVLLHTIIGIIPFADGSFGLMMQNALKPFLIGGVDLFFVLSGFLISGILMDNKGASNFFRAFWTRRIARIFPVYFLLYFSFLAAIAIHDVVQAPWMELWLLQERLPLWPYAIFMQNFAMADVGEGGPRWIGVTWSLAVEEQFYFLLPPIVYLVARRSLLKIAIAAIIAAPFVRTAVWHEYTWFSSYVLLPGRMDTLMFGVLGAWIVRNPKALEKARQMRGTLDAVAIALAVLIAMGAFTYLGDLIESQTLAIFVRTLRYSALAAFFGIVVLRIFLVEEGPYRRALRNPALVHIGMISYAMYMYHQAVNGLLHGYVYHQEPRVETLPQFGLALCVLAIAYTLSRLSMAYMERPIRRLGQKVKYRRPEPAPVDSGVLLSPAR